MRTRLLLLIVAFLSWAGMSNAQNEDKDKPLLTLACISDIHTERSLIENIDDILEDLDQAIAKSEVK